MRNGSSPSATAGSNRINQQAVHEWLMMVSHPRVFTAIVLLAILTGVVADSAVAARRPPKDYCATPTLMEPVKKLLTLKYYQEWRPIAVSDLPRTHQRMWRRSLNRFDCPGIAIGHFERKSNLAYAFSLKPRDPRKSGWRLIVISKTTQGTYHDRALGQTDERVPPYVIFSVPPGEYTDAFETESVRIRLDGIQVEQMEAGAMLFYWRDGQYRTLILAEHERG